MSTQRRRVRCAALLAVLLLGGVFGAGCAASDEFYERNRQSGGWVWGRDGAIRHPGPQAIGGDGG